LTLALVGGEWSTSRPGRFTPGERAPGTHRIGGWVDLRAGLNDLEKRKFFTLPDYDVYLRIMNLSKDIYICRRLEYSKGVTLYNISVDGGKSELQFFYEVVWWHDISTCHNLLDVICIRLMSNVKTYKM
jgi:hypothetical protein